MSIGDDSSLWGIPNPDFLTNAEGFIGALKSLKFPDGFSVGIVDYYDYLRDVYQKNPDILVNQTDIADPRLAMDYFNDLVDSLSATQKWIRVVFNFDGPIVDFDKVGDEVNNVNEAFSTEVLPKVEALLTEFFGENVPKLARDFISEPAIRPFEFILNLGPSARVGNAVRIYVFKTEDLRDLNLID